MKLGIRLASVVGAGALVTGLAASPALAAGGPSSSAQATVTVQQAISFAFTSGTSFTLAPGVTDHGALAFNISSNDSNGYTVSLAAPDLVINGGSASIAAGDLVYNTFTGGSQVIPINVPLSNSASVFITTSAATGGDQYSQDWVANIPANTAPGSYSTTLTFVAAGR